MAAAAAAAKYARAGDEGFNVRYDLYLLARAHLATETFPDAVRRALDQHLPPGVHAEVLAAPVKSRARTTSKYTAYHAELKAAEPGTALHEQKGALRHELSGAYLAHALQKDLARLTIKSETVADAHHIFAAVSAALDVTSVKNRLSKPTRDVLLTVRLGCGLIAEVQIHQGRVLDLKALTHTPYEVDRLPAGETPLPNALVSFNIWVADALAPENMRLQASHFD